MLGSLKERAKPVLGTAHPYSTTRPYPSTDGMDPGQLLTFWRGRAETAEAELEKQRKIRLAERAFMKRSDMKLEMRWCTLALAWDFGVTFGNDNIQRGIGERAITYKYLAGITGLSERIAGLCLKTLTTPPDDPDDTTSSGVEPPGDPDSVMANFAIQQEKEAPKEPPEKAFTPYFRVRQETKLNKAGKPFKVNIIGLPEGQEWGKTWDDPLANPAPPPPPRTVKAATRQTKRRDEVTYKLTELEEAKRILAQCPSCGSTDVLLVCHACGAKTPAAELPEFLADRPKRAPRAPKTIPTVAADDATDDSPEGVDEAPCMAKFAIHKVNETNSDECSNSPAKFAIQQPDELVAEWLDEDEASTAVALESVAEEVHVAEEVDDMEATTAAEVVSLVNGDYALACVLARAVNVLWPAFGSFPNYVVMQRRTTEKGNKYLTVNQPLTLLLLAQHVLGSITLGGGLLTSAIDADGPRLCRAVAYDSDTQFSILIAAARKLAEHGITALLVQNVAKRASGHLWVLFDGDVEAAKAFALLETWAPMLANVPERFPNLKVRGGHRLRLPGSCYLPVGSDPVPVQVALSGVGPDLDWEDALSPMAWVLIADAVTPAAAIDHAWLPPDARPKPAAPPPAAKPVRVVPSTASGARLEDVIERFNAEHPLHSLVEVNRGGMFHSPWHTDSSPSCKAYEDGHWTDFSRDNRGGDALALWCATNGRWGLQDEKPDRIGALISLGLWEEKKQGCRLQERDGRVLAHIHFTDSERFKRACASFKKATHAQYSPIEKAWVIPKEQLATAQTWARDFIAAEKGAMA